MSAPKRRRGVLLALQIQLDDKMILHKKIAKWDTNNNHRLLQLNTSGIAITTMDGCSTIRGARLGEHTTKKKMYSHSMMMI